jgi:AhpC/TSA family.
MMTTLRGHRFLICKYWKNEVAVQYGIQAIPQNFLLDPEGKIIGKNLRGEELQQKLAEIFK